MTKAISPSCYKHIKQYKDLLHEMRTGMNAEFDELMKKMEATDKVSMKAISI